METYGNAVPDSGGAEDFAGASEPWLVGDRPVPVERSRRGRFVGSLIALLAAAVIAGVTTLALVQASQREQAEDELATARQDLVGEQTLHASTRSQLTAQEAKTAGLQSRADNAEKMLDD